MRREDRRLIVWSTRTRPRRGPHPTKAGALPSRRGVDPARHLDPAPEWCLERHSGPRVLERAGAEMTARSAHRLAALAHTGDRLAQRGGPNRAGDHRVAHHEGRSTRDAELV